jgi:hypothetical protein
MSEEYRASKEAHNAYAEVRDADGSIDEAINAACKVAVVEELRRIVTGTTYGWAIGDQLMRRVEEFDPDV